MNGFFLLVRKGVQHPFGQALEKPDGRGIPWVRHGQCVGVGGFVVGAHLSDPP
jgi:hypothetical protein